MQFKLNGLGKPPPKIGDQFPLDPQTNPTKSDSGLKHPIYPPFRALISPFKGKMMMFILFPFRWEGWDGNDVRSQLWGSTPSPAGGNWLSGSSLRFGLRWFDPSLNGCLRRLAREGRTGLRLGCHREGPKEDRHRSLKWVNQIEQSCCLSYDIATVCWIVLSKFVFCDYFRNNTSTEMCVLITNNMYI